MIVLETERLRLRWLAESDAPFILQLVNEPSFVQNIGDRGVRTLDDARRYMAKGPIASYHEHGYGLYLVERRADGESLGMCGLVKRAFLEHADIGFAFLPAHWSQGYALESARAVLEHAHEVLGLARVDAIVSPGNAPSQRLLRKLGLEFERVLVLPPPGDTVEMFVPAARPAAQKA